MSAPQGTTLTRSQLLRVAKAMSDPKRLAILEFMADHDEVGCAQICERFPLKQPTISHHMRTLSEAGLIRTRREGPRLFASVNEETLEAFMQSVRQRTLAPGRRPAASA